MDKKLLKNAIMKFGTSSLFQSSIDLFGIMNYPVIKSLEYQNVSFVEFENEFNDVFVGKKVNEDKLLKNDWISANLLFQLSEDEIKHHIKEFKAVSDESCIMESYLFWAVELNGEKYTKADIANFTREFNKIFNIPCFILFKYHENITFAIIDRRTNKIDAEKDVLEKVTLIKDISILNPHRGHTDILAEFEFSQLRGITFSELHEEWKKKLNIELLSKNFYRDISNWYYWASGEVYFPGAPVHARFLLNPREDMEVRAHNAKNLIRLLTRILFVWFIKEKGLIPEEIFEEEYLNQIIIDFDPSKKTNYNPAEGSRYYKAILQNLFFATLNQVKGKREFRKDSLHYNKTNLMRYKRFFRNPEGFLELMESKVPFMNGGLFECLDTPDPIRKTKSGSDLIIREDGFSDHDKNELEIPDYIFFGKHGHVDLSSQIGKEGKNIQVLGLIEILKSYKFTISENTPVEEDIALDPELLGKVFENLLASYNPETQTTARKQTGSFYTPRPIVDYMVDESLKAYLKQAMKGKTKLSEEDLGEALDILFSYTEKEHIFTKDETDTIITAINSCKILDPACGSGAFPMGVLQKMVYVLHKLDPKNEMWKKKQIDKANGIDDPNLREKAIESINEAFESNELDYGRKLYLIENCIYGVDIQPIATQISKLRFFISLMVDQKVDWEKDNFGVLALPNLESNFITANTLINIEKPKGWENIFKNEEMIKLEKERKKIRDSLFSIKSLKRKQELRENRKLIEQKMSEVLLRNGFDINAAKRLVEWNPYEQNSSSSFFDSEWMFGVTDGFDVVIGNPPYIGEKGNKEMFHEIKNTEFGKMFYQRRMDFFYFFIAKGIELLKSKGIISFITTNYWVTASGGQEKLRPYLKKMVNILKYVDFGEYKIFDSALGQHNSLFLFEKNLDEKYKRASVTKISDFNKAKDYLLSNILRQDLKLDGVLRFKSQTQNEIYDEKTYNIHFNNNTVFDIIEKIQQKGDALLGELSIISGGVSSSADKVRNANIEYCSYEDQKASGIKIGDGILVLEKDEVIRMGFSEAEMMYIKPYFKSSEIEKYITNNIPNKFLVYATHNNADEIILQKNIYKHLCKYKSILENRSQDIELERAMQKGHWFVLTNGRNKINFAQPKIVCPYRAKDNVFGYNEVEWFAGRDVYYLVDVKIDIKFLLGLLNSKLVKFWLEYKGKRKGDIYEIYPEPLKNIPIVNSDREIIRKIADETDNIISIVNSERKYYGNSRQSELLNIQEKINQLVYNLYNLSNDEIEFIDKL